MRRPLAPATLLSLTAGLALGLPTAPQAMAAPVPFKGANTAAVQDDFNGDGYRDLAVGAPGARVGTADAAGAVVVMYGSSTGISATRKKLITQATTGVPGTPELGDTFGGAVATGDLDRDGYADLLVGSPREDIGTMQSYGSVTVLWGSSTGLTGGATLTAPAGLREHSRFGAMVKAADTTGDGYPDVGVSSDDAGIAYRGPFTRTGSAAARSIVRAGARGVAAGDVNGDGAAERFWLSGPADDNHNGHVTVEDKNGELTDLPAASGMTGVVADLDRDGYGDLVLGKPWDDRANPGRFGTAHIGGEITVWYGGSQGIDPAQTPRVIHQDTAGVPGGGEWDDEFGASVSADDVTGDGHPDLLVGAPGEALGANARAGMTVLLRGSATGLTTTGATAYHQDITGVPGGPEAGDLFGHAVHLADLTGDRRADVVAGVPGENGDGAVWFSRGTSSGPATTGSFNVSGTQTGITVGGGLEALFGYSVNGPRSIF